ncbi:MAG: 2-oxoglutarate dehydrogenase complex dihydrolipoyllysine-residue succinyltransferase [Pirellulaceae bacterium]
MSTELVIPEVGESIQEVQIAHWRKQEGDRVEQDEELVELETEKASLDLPSPTTGVITKILKREGDRAAVGEAVAVIDEKASAEPVANGENSSGENSQSRPKSDEKGKKDDESSPAPQQRDGLGQRTTSDAREQANEDTDPGSAGKDASDGEGDEVAVTPSARRELRQQGLRAQDVPVRGKRLRRKDVLDYVKQQESETHRSEDEHEPELTTHTVAESQTQDQSHEPASSHDPDRADLEDVQPMSWIRRTIAERLVKAQQQAALLTTFNEIDMTRVIDLRRTHGDAFQQRHQAKLGFMSFFVKALIEALRHAPELNAMIRGDDIVYRRYYDIGIAIGSGKGLVVPVIRNAERLSFAGIENSIADFAQRAQSNSLKPAELQGGTFTVSNGGVYGSLLSTPIVNPPQSGVLGLHAIQERPVAREGQVVIRPMMYVALTYDHRIVDGREAVGFLRHIKELIEDPARLLLDV